MSDSLIVKGVTFQVRVDDFKDGKRWYEQLLGRPADFVSDTELCEWQIVPGAWLQVAEGIPAPGNGPVRFAVEDILKERERLMSEMQLKVSKIERVEGVSTWCDFEDPCGNLLGLFQE